MGQRLLQQRPKNDEEQPCVTSMVKATNLAYHDKWRFGKSSASGA